jgi:hypothetical protein
MTATADGIFIGEFTDDHHGGRGHLNAMDLTGLA